MLNQKKIINLIQKIADEENLPYHVVEKIFSNQFKIVKDIIQSGEFKIIQLPNLGKFAPSKKKMKYHGKTKENRNNTISSS